MHVRELVELGALVAAHAAPFIRRGNPLAQRHVEEYWLASRCRHDRWGHALKEYRIQADRTRAEEAWRRVRPTILEILPSELLTRVWTTVAMAHDRHSGTASFEPIVRSVMMGHLEARNRALNIMVYGEGFSAQEGVQLNRLRRRIERWTDMLLGYLMTECDAADLAFDARRARDFGADLRFEHKQQTGPHAWQLTLASLRAAFRSSLTEPTPNPDLNRRIAAGILACFPSEMFDSTGLLKSVWMNRLDRTATDMQGLIQDLLAPEETRPVNRLFVRR